MPIVFCSAKLSKLIGLKTRLPSISIDNWNTHLFPMKGRKCLVFAHKETCYSFVIFDVLKKDLADFKKLFIDNFLKQLSNDGLLTDDYKNKIMSDFNEFEISTTDGDKSAIGFLNDCIYRLTWPDEPGNREVAEMLHYVENYYNENPLGKKNYQTPKELMLQRLKEYT